METQKAKLGTSKLQTRISIQQYHSSDAPNAKQPEENLDKATTHPITTDSKKKDKRMMPSPRWFVPTSRVLN
ncbi:MAG: hypothetical protein ACM3JE_04210 [Betaproteobacteria bacterium]